MSFSARVMHRRVLRKLFGLLALAPAIVSLENGHAWGQQVQVTREMLVAAVERGPGPTKGREDAPITIVEFSDFQCSFCRKFWKETLPKIDAEYIKPGKVRFVYRHLAALGPYSERAAQAAECAREQGKFWPYHDLLFGRAGRLAFTDARLQEYARELKLDSAAFDACLGSGRHKERILGESGVAAQLGATGTPTFLINGKLLIGAHPFETFKRILDAILTKPTGNGPSRNTLKDRMLAAAAGRGLRFAKSTGDGHLMTFDSVAGAIETAATLLNELRNRPPDISPGPPLEVRAGISYGEILLDEGGSRHAAAINKAFRLQGLSRENFSQVEGAGGLSDIPERNRIFLDEEAAQEVRAANIPLRFLGFASLKGFSGLHRVYEVLWEMEG